MLLRSDMVDGIRSRFEALFHTLDERQQRQWAAAEARTAGRGGIAAVARVTGMSTSTLWAGLKELEELDRQRAAGVPVGEGVGRGASRRRIRAPGAGRKRITTHDPTLLADLDALVDPSTRGDPMSPLRWTCKSTSQLAAELARKGHKLSARTVAALLRDKGYSLQGNRKTQEGGQHPDRNAQFEYISERAKDFASREQPVISVDTKKKELVGEFKNAGREWHPKGEPTEVNVHDFPDDSLGRAIPYGIYDFFTNTGWVRVGIDHDTADFAVASIRSWWEDVGKATYPNAKELLITADCGGSNGNRLRAWKVALQRMADDTGLAITVSHLPPGTSKWNKIEHRLFCHITRNWRGRPLVSFELIVNLIGATTTRAGLKVSASLDREKYATGGRVSNAAMRQLSLTRNDFHGEWNYTLTPRPIA